MDRCPFPSLLIRHVSQFWSPGRPTLRSCLVLHKERLVGMSSSGRVREGTWMWIVYSLGSEANTLTKFIYFVFLCFSLCVRVCGPSTLPELALNVFLIHSPLFFAEACSLTEHRTSQACPQRFPVSSSRVQGLQEVHQSHVVLRGCWILTVPILLVWQALYPFSLLRITPTLFMVLLLHPLWVSPPNIIASSN